jgi:hypothetical protein
VVRSEIRAPGGYSVEMGELALLGGITFPRHQVLRSPGTELDLTYKDLELNLRPDATMFDLAPPENVPVVDVDASGAALRP